MITTKELTAFIESKLNEFSVSVNGRNYQFLIHSDEGEFIDAIDGNQKQLPTNLLNGVLIEQSSTPIPLAGLNSVLLMQTLEVIIPVNNAQWRIMRGKRSGGIDYAMSALNNFVEACAGLTGSLTEKLTDEEENTGKKGKTFSYALSVSTPSVGAENVYGEVGRAVPVTMQVSWQFIENGVLANDVTITLNGTPVVLMDGAIARTRTGDSSNVDGSNEMKTVITQQGLTFTVIIPYKRGDVSATLMQDMLDANLEKTYELAYQDPIISRSWTVVCRSITSSLTAQKAISIVAMFEIAREFEEVEGD